MSHLYYRGSDTIQVVAGEVAVLPCDLAVYDPRDSVQLVLWIKEGVHTPLYSYDFREPLGPRETKPHSTSTLAARTSFRTDTTPATLVVERVVAEDAGMYRCRVDHLISPTTNTRTALTVIVPSRRVHITWSVGEASPVTAENLVLGPFKEGDSPVINCTSQDGWPAPSVVWYEGDEILDDTYNVVFPDASISTSTPAVAASTGFIGTSIVPSGTSMGLTSPIADPGGGVAAVGGNTGTPNTAIVVNTLTLGTLTRADLHRRITCLAINLNTTQPASETVTIDMTRR
ncbi:hypothetical protein Pcinc_044111 [Petrolisthes cinctipes]|uniref:Ig-like domain-containing protein n=1 Tax=Petrolisthes cinctipes TaxID=88211 RepID=A0AAE1BF99_PETCI|nr:hypothetical protein Pcinc_044111 [Petrolisthes cinctipes]